MKSVFNKNRYCMRSWKHPFILLNQFLRDIKYCFQRITKGYSDIDVWNMNDWFLEIIPSMLEELKETANGTPSSLANGTDETYARGDKDGFEKWKRILGEMAYLFRESYEKTCEKKNPYAEEYDRASDQFTTKYGLFGEQFKTPEEIEKERVHGYNTMHTMEELPEYKDICEKHWNEEKKLKAYRNERKDKAFELFSKWFWDLWD